MADMGIQRAKIENKQGTTTLEPRPTTLTMEKPAAAAEATQDLFQTTASAKTTGQSLAQKGGALAAIAGVGLYAAGLLGVAAVAAVSPIVAPALAIGGALLYLALTKTGKETIGQARAALRSLGKQGLALVKQGLSIFDPLAKAKGQVENIPPALSIQDQALKSRIDDIMQAIEQLKTMHGEFYPAVNRFAEKMLQQGAHPVALGAYLHEMGKQKANEALRGEMLAAMSKWARQTYQHIADEPLTPQDMKQTLEGPIVSQTNDPEKLQAIAEAMKNRITKFGKAMESKKIPPDQRWGDYMLLGAGILDPVRN